MPHQLIFACLFTGIYDVNRSGILPNDDYSLIEKWADSLTALKLNGIIFHNSFSEATVTKYSSSFITFKEVKYNPVYNLSVNRYFVYLDYIMNHHYPIESLFITDSTDVEVVNNPFEQPLFYNNRTALFCGDEPTTLNNEWMANHSTHFRDQIPEFAAYEKKFANETLLNCGIIGGKINTMTNLLNELVKFHTQYNQDNKTLFTGDMGAFNYIVRTQFNTEIFHGVPVNTLFKGFEKNNQDCWFRHK
jgi:hypothetical protein